MLCAASPSGLRRFRGRCEVMLTTLFGLIQAALPFTSRTRVSPLS
jgi:hypothetical protein